MLQNHAWTNEAFRVQSRTVDFNTTEYETFIDYEYGFSFYIVTNL